MASGVWEMPMGRVPIHEQLAQMIKDNSPLLDEDSTAHIREHSLELQLPFVQYLNPRFQLVPIALQQLRYEECEELGTTLARSIQTFGNDVIIVASNDMTHFEPQEMAKQKDTKAIDRILEIDPRGLYDTVSRHRISMCGVIPATVMLSACKNLGATQGKLIKYATSGDVSGDYSSVVGYAGILIQ
jgi:AmmeMemoRadiSam system protein B